jgi:hypothetical protein
MAWVLRRELYPKVYSIGAQALHFWTSYCQIRHILANHALSPSFAHSPLQLPEGFELVNKAIQAAPACAKYRHSKGLLLEKADQLHEAADSLERACEKDPYNAKVGTQQISARNWNWEGSRSRTGSRQIFARPAPCNLAEKKR